VEAGDGFDWEERDSFPVLLPLSKPWAEKRCVRENEENMTGEFLARQKCACGDEKGLRDFLATHNTF